MSAAFKVLVLLHLLCVIGGFGAVSYNALYMSLAQRRQNGRTAGGIIEVNVLVSGLAELLIYAAFVFGIGAVSASHSVFKFSQAWVAASMAVFLVDIGILHGWIRPHQRHYQALALEAEKVPAGEIPPQFVTMQALEKQVSLGWGVFNILVAVVVYLMVFKPGS